MKKKIVIYLLAAALLSQTGAMAAENWRTQYSWAAEAVDYGMKAGIITGMPNGDLALGDSLTKAQCAKMLVAAFSLTGGGEGVGGVPVSHWAYGYLRTLKPYLVKVENYQADQTMTREEFAATLVKASGLTEGSIRNSDILSDNFSDFQKVDSAYQKLLCIAVERGYYQGSDGMLRPKDSLSRAEACTMIYRVIAIKNGSLTPELGVKQSSTPLVGKAECTAEQAKAWAQKKGAHERFVNIADLYWKYGEITGIRPEILYAQAAKETGFGKYTGAVTPEMNNWAGIKKYGQNGDATEDHESFATPEDGVRAHFNHMSAYIGLAPIGQVHGRYQSIASMPWAGTVKTVEQLGGKWCPDLYYGYSILHNYVEQMCYG